jgi:thioredoxin-like negative regulator of GroEL
MLVFCVCAAGCANTSTGPSLTPSNATTTTTSAQVSTSASISTPANLTVLYFYSPTCPYRQALENTTSFRQLENTSKVPVKPIVSAASPLTDQYNVTYIPTLILLNHGAEVGRWVNATNASAINAQISSLLKAG